MHIRKHFDIADYYNFTQMFFMPNNLHLSRIMQPQNNLNIFDVCRSDVAQHLHSCMMN